jgi:hypothetical protein
LENIDEIPTNTYRFGKFPEKIPEKNKIWGKIQKNSQKNKIWENIPLFSLIYGVTLKNS